jgi:DUF2892 family protein
MYPFVARFVLSNGWLQWREAVIRKEVTKMFRRNVGRLDRAVRLVSGALLLPIGLFTLGGVEGNTLGAITALVGFIGLATGITGFCPLYMPLGISTVQPRPKPVGVTGNWRGDPKPLAGGEEGDRTDPSVWRVWEQTRSERRKTKMTREDFLMAFAELSPEEQESIRNALTGKVASQGVWDSMAMCQEMMQKMKCC